MNVTRLLDYAAAANMAARVDIRRTGSSVRIEWQWKKDKSDVFHTESVSIPVEYFEEERWPYFNARAIIIGASENMEKYGGVPHKSHMLFIPGEYCMTFHQERSLLNKKLEAGLISVESYGEAMIELYRKRGAETAQWSGVNFDG